jgi:hypothetical protein
MFQAPPRNSARSAAKFDIISKKEPLWEMLPWVKEKNYF